MVQNPKVTDDLIVNAGKAGCARLEIDDLGRTSVDKTVVYVENAEQARRVRALLNRPIPPMVRFDVTRFGWTSPGAADSKFLPMTAAQLDLLVASFES